MNRSCRRLVLVAGLGLLLGGCALGGVDHGTRDSIDDHVKPGMRMNAARDELEGMHYLCSRHTGAYVDEYGDEHPVNAPFFICDARPGAVSFVCNTRTQVTLIPDGGRVRSVQINKAPSCIKQ